MLCGPVQILPRGIFLSEINLTGSLGLKFILKCVFNGSAYLKQACINPSTIVYSVSGICCCLVQCGILSSIPALWLQEKMPVVTAKKTVCTILEKVTLVKEMPCLKLYLVKYLWGWYWVKYISLWYKDFLVKYFHSNLKPNWNMPISQIASFFQSTSPIFLNYGFLGTTWMLYFLN